MNMTHINYTVCIHGWESIRDVNETRESRFFFAIPGKEFLDFREVLYALRVLRAYGLCDSALHTIYRSVVVAKLLCASSAWEGFANATDRNKIQSFINKSKKMGTVHPIYLILTVCAPQ